MSACGRVAGASHGDRGRVVLEAPEVHCVAECAENRACIGKPCCAMCLAKYAARPLRPALPTSLTCIWLPLCRHSSRRLGTTKYRTVEVRRLDRAEELHVGDAQDVGEETSQCTIVAGLPA